MIKIPVQSQKIVVDAPINRILLGLWLFAMTIVVWQLYRVESASLERVAGEKPIGTLSEVTNKVAIRPENSIVWYDGVQDQEIYLGDTIATGGSTHARVLLFSGETLDLGSDTVVEITSDFGEHHDDDWGIMQEISGTPTHKKVNVVKGDVTASVNEEVKQKSSSFGKIPWLNQLMPASSPVLLVSDGKTVAIDQPLLKSERPMELAAKSNTEPMPTATPEKFDERQRKHDKVESAKKEKLALEKQKLRDEEKKKLADLSENEAKKKTSTKDQNSMIPKITSDFSATFWTNSQQDLARLEPIRVSLSVAVPKSQQNRKWTPFVEVFSPVSRSATLIEGHANQTTDEIILTPAILNLMLSPTLGKMKIQLRPGIRIVGVENTIKSEDTTSLTVGNLSAFGNGPVTIEMKTFKWNSSELKTSSWIKSESSDLLTQKVTLYHARDLLRLRPLLDGATSFSIRKGTSLASSTGVHFMKDENLEISIFSQKASLDAIRKIGQLYAADFAFTGATSDLIVLPELARNRLGVVIAAAEKYGTVHILSRRRMIALTSQDLEDQSSGLAAISKNITAVFKKPVSLEFMGH